MVTEVLQLLFCFIFISATLWVLFEFFSCFLTISSLAQLSFSWMNCFFIFTLLNLVSPLPQPYLIIFLHCLSSLMLSFGLHSSSGWDPTLILLQSHSWYFPWNSFASEVGNRSNWRILLPMLSCISFFYISHYFSFPLKSSCYNSWMHNKSLGSQNAPLKTIPSVPEGKEP